jgi:glycine cleavage system transcriptional repressor
MMRSVNEYAITVIGHDRPGIIADVAEVLAGLGMNLTDSTMTRLRGHFAMTLICSAGGGAGADEAGAGAGAGEGAGAGGAGAGAAGAATAQARKEDVEAALHPLTADGSLLATVSLIDPEAEPAPTGGHYVLSVHGADRLGIVATVTRALAEFGGNITDLTTRLSGSLYVLVAELDLPAGSDVAMISERLGGVARTLGVEVTLRASETDLL